MSEIPSIDQIVNSCYRPSDGRMDHGLLLERLAEREGFVLAEITKPCGGHGRCLLGIRAVEPEGWICDYCGCWNADDVKVCKFWDNAHLMHEAGVDS